MTNETVAIIMMIGIIGLVIYIVKDMTSDNNKLSHH